MTYAQDKYKINKKGSVKMKVKLNLSLGENTVKGLKKEAEELEISVSGLITMLFKQYEREKLATQMMQNQELQRNIEELLKIKKEKE